MIIAAADDSIGADYRIRKDDGGFLEQYKLKYATIRDRGDRVVIDGVCNSACTLVLGIVPLNADRDRMGREAAHTLANVARTSIPAPRGKVRARKQKV